MPPEDAGEVREDKVAVVARHTLFFSRPNSSTTISVEESYILVGDGY